MKTKITIISGFLGSGKTTFIKKILDETKDLLDTVIIENEFGEVSIDGSILNRNGIEVKEINSGCICCSVSNDFEKSLRDILSSFNPKHIIIEPSGVGKLSDIIKICKKFNSEVELGTIITIIDITKFSLYLSNFGEFYKDQIENSNVILFSRLENYNKNNDVESIDEINSELLKLNKKLVIIDKEWDNLNSNEILSYEGKISINMLDLFTHKHEHSADKFESISIEIIKNIKKEDFLEIVNKFDSKIFGNIIRAKGSFSDGDNFYQFDYVPEEINLEKVDFKIDNNYLVVIGENIHKDNLKNLF